eukprot:TRINITY_DN22695_c0_g1_i2.p1 TRINITY_DN22695_c0_g1~~TRINITY_DN22695_c0_g1_i2.p1  ORF type:complete len:165 (+),score=18.93 TRINITY_DN22695_c0_g1_i2:201-695(+)
MKTDDAFFNPGSQLKQELISRLYGQGIPSSPLPSVKQNTTAFKPTRHLAKKRLRTSAGKSRRAIDEIESYCDPRMNLTNAGITRVNVAGTNTGFKSRNPEMASTGYRDNRFSVGMESITGINVISPLRPNSRMAMNRSNVYLSLIHICRCRRIERCRSRWSPYH